MRYRHLLLVAFFLLAVFNVSAQEWEFLDSEVTNQLNGISCPSQRVCYAAGGAPYTGGDGIIIKTTDGGGNWTIQELPTADYLKAIDCANNNVCFAAGDGVILKTADGDEWQIVNRTEQTFWDIDALSSSTAVAVGNLGSTLRTTNGGISWSGYLPPRTGTFRETLHAVFFVDENTGWRGGEGGMELSTNGGLSWSEFGSGPSSGVGDIFSLDGNILWATTNFDYIIKSVDGGERWEQHRVSSAGGFPAIEFANDTLGWALGNGAMEESNDGGLTWEVLRLERSTFFRDIDCPSRRLCYAVGNDGIVLRWGEPLYGIIRPANYTLQVPDYPEEEEPEEPVRGEVSCQPVMDDCESGWNPVFQYNESGCAVSYLCMEGEVKSEDANAFLQGLSGFSSEQLSAFLGQVPGLSPNERISVYVTRADAEPLVLSFRLEEGKVADIALKEQEDWTLKAETTEETLNKILAAEDPATTALAAINSKEIQLSGRTFGKKVKLAFLRMGLKLAGIFG